MQGDAITGFNAARRQPARHALGFRGKPFVSPGLVVKHQCRAFRPSLRLVRQGIHWSHFHWLVSCVEVDRQSWTGRVTAQFQFLGEWLQS
jgi:hypothetical protein